MVKLLHKLYTKHKKGFTLFEVLVVLVILAVLAVIAVPTYNKIIKKSRVSDGLYALDMLAGAQDKYFVDHGVYAQSLTALNAPFKEYRVLNSTNPDIVTPNFTYDKVYTQHCIRAKANIGGNYTLVKNYKKKDKVVCLGPDCANVSEYVDEISDEAYSDLCPDEIEPECEPEGAIDSGYYTGGKCNYDGEIPEYGKGADPGSGGLNAYVCGLEYTQKVCRNHVWTFETICTYMGDYCRLQGKILDPKTCECISTCDPNNKPSCTSVSGYTTCDPCPNDPDIPSIIEQMLQGGSGTHCFHCGYIPSGMGEPICDTETGQWHCPGAENGTCTEVSASFEPYHDCNGKDLPGANPDIQNDNTCGQKNLSNVRCWQEITGSVPTLDPVYSNTCELKDGNSCFTGDTRDCTLPDTGETGIEHCVDCNWDNNCVPNVPSGPCQCKEEELVLLNLSVPGYTCAQYSPMCVTDENDPTSCHWEVDTNNMEWIQEDYECETGWVAPCDDPTDSCDNGQGRGGTGGGGRTLNPDCCDSGCKQECEEGCTNNGQIPPGFDYDGCVSECIEEHGGNCQGGGGGGNNGSGTGNDCYPPAQGCAMGYIWDNLKCQCVRPNPGQPPTPPAPNVPTKICQNCQWSCCSHCDFSNRPPDSDYTSQCAFYRTKCGWEEYYNDAVWWEGTLYYSQCAHNNSGSNYSPARCLNAEWFGDNNCETGLWKFCNNHQGKQFCNDCHWSGCNPFTYTISNASIIVTAYSEYKYCPDGIITQNVSGSTCTGNDEYGCWLDLHSVAMCRNNNSQNIGKCNKPSSQSYEQYCGYHPGRRCVIDNVSFCEATGYLECCPGWGLNCGNAGGSCSETYDCERNVQILQCN